jgi:hypothetical protein
MVGFIMTRAPSLQNNDLMKIRATNWFLCNSRT